MMHLCSVPCEMCCSAVLSDVASAPVVEAKRSFGNAGTIHQPSIDIFEAFDDLLLMKSGGYITYHGPLGEHSRKLVEYFEVCLPPNTLFPTETLTGPALAQACRKLRGVLAAHYTISSLKVFLRDQRGCCAPLYHAKYS